jgi:hypothetical protein
MEAMMMQTREQVVEVASGPGLVAVRIVGETPLLMNNPASMALQDGARKVVPTPEEEAASKAYWADDRSTLVIWSEHLHRAMLNAAKPYRVEGSRRTKLAPLLAGCIEIEPAHIPLRTTAYEIDLRSVVIRGSGRVVRARPKVWPWDAEFSIFYEAKELGRIVVGGTLREVLERAGRLVGILDFRPEKGGRFGKFRVDRWDVL